MRILALIPARGGSKRVPRKNIRCLAGKPLIFWTIATALDVLGICDVLVSTDSEEIAQISVDAGAKVPWLRPNELATDLAGSVEVALHALSWYEMQFGKVDGILLLQPTSPFRKKETLLSALKAFKEDSSRAIFSVSPIQPRLQWLYTSNEGKLERLIESADTKSGGDILHALNGAIYLISPSQLRKAKSFEGENPYPIIMPNLLEAIDIDTELDFQLAELMCNELGRP